MTTERCENCEHYSARLDGFGYCKGEYFCEGVRMLWTVERRPELPTVYVHDARFRVHQSFACFGFVPSTWVKSNG